MFVFLQSQKYRTDIDGLRAIAVIAVIIFHLGYLPGGYLGVDIFFVISGYLITGIIYHELHQDSFSMKTFYLRRIRRIIPLSLFICLFALVAGVMVMLPDDLENLSQSVIATSFFSNNILQAFTTRNYWDVVNEFKPLMHTWSLGVEEQYYFVYPLLLALVFKRNKSWVLPALIVLTLVSLALFLGPFRDYFKFYLLPFRFFELALGGIAAILLRDKLFKNPFAAVQLALLLAIMCFGVLFMPAPLALMLTVVLTVMVLSTANDQDKIASWVLQNRISVAVGLISYSLYMWHQLLLAYGRYMFFHEPELVQILILVALMLGLSTLSYLFVEQPFRKKNFVTTRTLLIVVGALFLVTNAGAAYVVLNAGVVRDVPELDIKAGEAMTQMHAAYNDRVYQLDKDFEAGDKLKVLVLGDSFARDWANVLLESAAAEQLDVTYIYNVREVEKVNARAAEADLVFYSRPNPERLEALNIDPGKLYAVGTKNFGISNGIFYNYRGDDYFDQRTRMEEGYLSINEALKSQWGERFLDYIGKVIDEDLTVPVFTPAKKFISADCRHLTRPGAQYFASLFQEELAAIFAAARP